MKPTHSYLAPFGVGLVAILLLLWVWQENRDDFARLQGAYPTPALDASSTALIHSAPTPTATPLAPAIQSLFDQLLRQLTRRDTRPREAIVTFKDDAAFRRFLAQTQASGISVLGRLDALRSLRLRFDSPAALRELLAANATDFAAASANFLVSVPSAPSTPAQEDRADIEQIPFGNSTLGFLGVPADHSTWGRGVTLAILDTGVMPDTTFGTGRLRTLDIGLGTTAGNGPDDGHGTAVAALAAGSSRDAAGVAPAASLLSIRVTDATGTSDTFTIAQGILAATDAGAKVINVSLGGYSTTAALDAAIGYATDRGAVIVAAAGNDQAAQLAWPAADSRVVSVGAVDRAGQQVTFSNSGSSLSLTAPGYGVQTAWLANQRVTVDGTSASAPLVAGAIAATLSQNSSLTPTAAAQVLTQTASDAGTPGADAHYGHGILNLDWAMNRHNPAHFDPAIASHSFDADNSQMKFVVQNRSGAAVAGLSLSLAPTGSSATPTLFTLPPLAAGESYVATVPVDPATLKAAGSLTYTTQLNLPPGLADSQPTNNRKSSTLTGPK